ncbi:MAG: dTDP-glucose pyrophosphorylase [Cyclobacteriaceae bacterium]|nr:dTDP-glucose pyrophosphorylase [Cyclobacteriaceae bacterium]
MEFNALIAAGGLANRLGALPCSKEIFPIVGQFTNDRTKVVCENLIEYYKAAGINNIHFIIRKGKWDIPQLLGDGSSNGVNISYKIMNLPFGTPFTLDQAYPFIKDKNIAMGFADIVMEPNNAFINLKEKLQNGKADIVLGIFPVKNYWKWDMVDFEDNKIKEIIIKGKRSDLKYGWSNAVWRPSFTEFMHDYLSKLIKSNQKGTRILPDGSERELYVGDVFTEAMKSGLIIDYEIFDEGYTTDIGTHEDMLDYLKESMK